MRLAAVSESLADAEALLEAAGAGFLHLDEDLRIRKYSRLIGEIFDLQPSSLGRPLCSINTLRGQLCQDEVEQAVRRGREWEAIFDRNGQQMVIKVLPEPDGAALLLLYDLEQIERARERLGLLSGEPSEVECALRESEARLKQIEQSNVALMRELDHRVKNVLHNVMAVAKQTAKKSASVESFMQAFQGRILAFAQLHHLLGRHEWRGAMLHELLRLVTKSYAGVPEPRVFLSGPPVRLTTFQTESLYLILHEIAANAVKHGALSDSSGEVDVRWAIAERGPKRELILKWRERKGPAVAAPAQFGFGGKLIGMIMQHELKGSTRYDFDRAGLTVELQFPLQQHDWRPSADYRPALLFVTGNGLPEMLEENLNEKGFRVLGPAGDVHTAWEILDSQRVDAAFVSLSIEEDQGLSVARELARRAVPFALFNGSKTEEHHSEFCGRLFINEGAAAQEIVYAAAQLLSSRERI